MGEWQLKVHDDDGAWLVQDASGNRDHGWAQRRRSGDIIALTTAGPTLPAWLASSVIAVSSDSL